MRIAKKRSKIAGKLAGKITGNPMSKVVNKKNQRLRTENFKWNKMSCDNYEKWLLEEIPPHSLKLFRAFFGIFVFLDSLFFLNGMQVYFPPQAVYLKYPGLTWWPEFPLYVHSIFLMLMALAGLSIAGGRRVRGAAAVVNLVLLHFFLRDAAFYLNHLVLVSLLSFLFIFIPAETKSKTPLLRYQLYSFIGIFYLSYWASGLEKFRADWFNGAILSVNLGARADASWIAAQVYNPTAVAVGVWAVLGLELLAPPALGWKRTRPFSAILLVLFHLFNNWAFNIGLFSYLMIFGIILYFDPAWPQTFSARIKLTLRLKRVRGSFLGTCLPRF